MNCKHTHNGVTRRQRLFAWVMLSVYVPMVLLASLHVHSLNDFSKAIDCEQCQCHTAVHHSGHITASNHHIDECLSCRFLSTQIDVPRMVADLVVKQTAVHLEYFLPNEPVARAVAHPSLRAPPFVL